MNEDIISTNYPVSFKDKGYDFLKEIIKNNNYSKIFLHVDENTKKYCLDNFLKHLNNLKIIEIESISGEVNKNINSCLKLWQVISEKGGDRSSLLINLGGGVVTDMGGFVASTFKRGIDYVNIPTTLLSMVDASVGSKTGIDFGVLKNQIGTFYDPKLVIIDPNYLDTLPEKEKLSGYAEVFKHSLISNNHIFNQLIKSNNIFIDSKVIHDSISVKNNIVIKDKFEKKERKSLNYGHTLGHAIESFLLNSNKKLLHGEAIAIGIILATFLSYKLYDFSKKNLELIKNHLKNLFGNTNFEPKEIEKIIDLLKHDKKNSHGKINFILLKEIGEPVYDVEISKDLILESFDFYLS